MREDSLLGVHWPVKWAALWNSTEAFTAMAVVESPARGSTGKLPKKFLTVELPRSSGFSKPWMAMSMRQI